MTSTVLIDTGPLVAFLNRRDRYHKWATAQLGAMRPPLRTCEAVLSEACFLLREYPGGSDAVIALVERGLVSVRFQLESESRSVGKLLKRYADVPMSLADAILVRMTELVADSAVLTLDGDFRIYRRNGREVIPVIMPEA